MAEKVSAPKLGVTFTQKTAPERFALTPGVVEMLKPPVYRNGFYAAIYSKKGGPAAKR